MNLTFLQLVWCGHLCPLSFYLYHKAVLCQLLKNLYPSACGGFIVMKKISSAAYNISQCYGTFWQRPYVLPFFLYNWVTLRKLHTIVAFVNLFWNLKLVFFPCFIVFSDTGSCRTIAMFHELIQCIICAQKEHNIRLRSLTSILKMAAWRPKASYFCIPSLEFFPLQWNQNPIPFLGITTWMTYWHLKSIPSETQLVYFLLHLHALQTYHSPACSFLGNSLSSCTILPSYKSQSQRVYLLQMLHQFFFES